ncbi:chorismate mutase [Latilactobacillus fuchuensis]|uniref:chorismate mutase n=1 Tax=Latilactobacillus fuchuensis TaxID=164393 RepID=UPI0020C74AE5|nr:chorismate mutase [Latilactobacillus fuchuensis]MCP8857322.1 chorismate mutase [Latilactobacillus fuchuensis]
MLEEQRQKIDAIDQQLAELFEARLSVAKEIATIKYENKIGLTNIQREKEVMDCRLEAVQDPELTDYMQELYQDLFLISKQYQVKTIKALRDQDED